MRNQKPEQLRRKPGPRIRADAQDKYIDPWELENWCTQAERTRKTETYSSGKSTLPKTEV